ncbi:hypothetical protein J3R83DRAFT_81 [Lanmaoa asiatica]|nr:hypothetical protein J3R83DRAFT_81 [Lanmaoa asiatica]
MIPEIRQPFDDKTIVATDPRDQTIGSAMRSLREQLEHTARHPMAGQESQDILPITPDIDRLRSRLQRLAVLPSPVTRLPPETLAYIFELCVVRGIESTPVPAQGTFCFAQVCKLWRAIAESDPRLWTSIHLYFPDSHENREEDVLRVKPMFDLHLKRSGTLPISLTFTDHRIYDSTTENLISLLVGRLRTHARRWKHISLQLPSCYFSLLFTFTSCDLSECT